MVFNNQIDILDMVKASDEGDSYKDFLEKLKPKKTTDDCYTPEPIYKVVLDYCRERYGLEGATVCRPFYPGGDYTRYDYPEGCVVIDNPPFSILGQIVQFYIKHGVRFFLFGPYLTIMGHCRHDGVTAIVTASSITYANGAEVPTSFLTNMEPGIRARSDAELAEALKAANEVKKVGLEKYVYPDEVLMASDLGYMSIHGVNYSAKAEKSVFIRQLEAQKNRDKSLFGGGLLLSQAAAAERAAAERAAAERAAAERAAAERAAATRWPLSEAEKALSAGMDGVTQ